MKRSLHPYDTDNIPKLNPAALVSQRNGFEYLYEGRVEYTSRLLPE